MAGYTGVEDYTNYYPGNFVESVTIRKTDDRNYPSGWDYSLHFGTVYGELVVRYDNAHKRSKGHERHVPDEGEEIEFPGMFVLLARFEREVARYRDRTPPTELDGGSKTMNSDSHTDRDSNDSDADEPRTLTVRVGQAERTRQEALDRVCAAERGEGVAERHVLDFEDEADLARLVSETNLELLRAIAEEDPESMRQVEETVGRDHKEVHRNLTELEALGVVEFVEEGRAKRPIVRFDELEITIPIRRDADRETDETFGDGGSEEPSEGQ